jgi:DNA-binding NarL/FixJ family response regulator
MPGGGELATRGIKRVSPHTRVIVFSALDDPRTRQDMFDVGADGYLVKGSLVTAIIASIQRAGIASANAREARAA